MASSAQDLARRSGLAPPRIRLDEVNRKVVHLFLNQVHDFKGEMDTPPPFFSPAARLAK
jgi:hypothetical protein